MDDWGRQFISDLTGRLSGPMLFGLLMLPAMAAISAIRHGIQDARDARPPYFSAILTHANDWGRWHREGWTSVFRILILGVLIDVVYQVIAFRSVRPLELIVVVFFLAFVPYVLLRGPMNRIAQHFIQSSGRPQPLIRR